MAFCRGAADITDVLSLEYPDPSRSVTADVPALRTGRVTADIDVAPVLIQAVGTTFFAAIPEINLAALGVIEGPDVLTNLGLAAVDYSGHSVTYAAGCRVEHMQSPMDGDGGQYNFGNHSNGYLEFSTGQVDIHACKRHNRSMVTIPSEQGALRKGL